MQQPNKFQSLLFVLPVLLALWWAPTTQAQETPSAPVPAVSAPAPTPPPTPTTPAPAPKVDKGEQRLDADMCRAGFDDDDPRPISFLWRACAQQKCSGTIMHSFILVGVVTIQWILWGYSVAFGPDVGGHTVLSPGRIERGRVEPTADYAATIPHMTFMVYQMMFAIITPA